jgi:hypothetical protein
MFCPFGPAVGPGTLQAQTGLQTTLAFAGKAGQGEVLFVYRFQSLIIGGNGFGGRIK